MRPTNSGLVAAVACHTRMHGNGGHGDLRFRSAGESPRAAARGAQIIHRGGGVSTLGASPPRARSAGSTSVPGPATRASSFTGRRRPTSAGAQPLVNPTQGSRSSMWSRQLGQSGVPAPMASVSVSIASVACWTGGSCTPTACPATSPMQRARMARTARITTPGYVSAKRRSTAPDVSTCGPSGTPLCGARGPTFPTLGLGR